jgi:hypothetical protein
LASPPNVSVISTVAFVISFGIFFGGRLVYLRLCPTIPQFFRRVNLFFVYLRKFIGEL